MLRNVQDPASKIDELAADGLSGVSGSLAYMVAEIEEHAHAYETWLEAAATPSGETNVADMVGVGGGSFQADAGNDDWGSWLQVVGSADTPARSGMSYYDFHRIVIASAERNAAYFLQVAFGESGASALSAGDYADVVIAPLGAIPSGAPIDIQTERHTVTTKAWIRAKCPGQNTGTINFYCGIHEYEG